MSLVLIVGGVTFFFGEKSVEWEMNQMTSQHRMGNVNNFFFWLFAIKKAHKFLEWLGFFALFLWLFEQNLGPEFINVRQTM